jgi:hypothetical protein
MTQPRLSLTTILPRLPPEGRAWINSLNATWRHGAEQVLNNIGEENFIRSWRVHRDDQRKLAHDFDL